MSYTPQRYVPRSRSEASDPAGFHECVECGYERVPNDPRLETAEHHMDGCPLEPQRATKRDKLPSNLYAAFNWTDAAGELQELRTLQGGELGRYCAESMQNARVHGEVDVHADDLAALHDWLRDHGVAQ